ncbi:MAG: hypothetical protein IJ853_02800 [Rickettsiales bacterium]|nr:hypothetical protein [Rickettsiales bacterium]
MDNIKVLLSSKRQEISNSIDVLVKFFKSVVREKDDKINVLLEENKSLRRAKNKVKKTINVGELKADKLNNRLLKKIIKKEIKISKQKNEIKKLQTETTEKNTIDTKNMTAFKVVALELEEKEKIIENNNSDIAMLRGKISELTTNIDDFTKKNEELINTVKILEEKNKKLDEVNNSQLKTIETITAELDDKKNKINVLKTSFIDILNDYNDILLRVQNG